MVDPGYGVNLAARAVRNVAMERRLGALDIVIEDDDDPPDTWIPTPLYKQLDKWRWN